VPGGSRANLAFLQPILRRPAKIDAELELIAADAQTSGGLLLAVDADRSAELVASLRARGLPAADVGELHAPSAERPSGTLTLR